MSVQPNKDRGIVLSTVKYGDKSVVANILTRESGRRGFMVSIGGRRNGVAAMLQPLSCIEFSYGGGRRASLRRATEMKLEMPFATIPFSPVRRSEALFLAELLCKAIPDDVPDPDLYDFVRASVEQLDGALNGDYNFHLMFMMRLTDYLGFAPDTERKGALLFDMESGLWTSNIPIHQNTVSGRMADLWLSFCTADASYLQEIEMNRSERQEMISLMEQYYRLHQPGFGELKSQKILAML